MAGSFVKNVKEMARGVNWVKFLVKFGRIKPSESGFEAASRLHRAWIEGRSGPKPFACADADLRRFNFDDDRAVFTFGTEPYSMKSNDYFLYIYEFGQWVDRRLASAAAQAKPKEPTLVVFDPDWLQKHFAARIPIVDSSGLTIDGNPTSTIRQKPVVEIDGEMEVRSFISRITNK